jgi:acyl carrier protein
MEQARERIRDFLIDEAHWDGTRSELTDDLPLIEAHVIDSMMLLRLVAWIESEYGIAIDDAEIVPSNFGSVERISRLLAGKLDQAKRD